MLYTMAWVDFYVLILGAAHLPRMGSGRGHHSDVAGLSAYRHGLSALHSVPRRGPDRRCTGGQQSTELQKRLCVM